MVAWGRHYAMVEPTHFRIAYAINPYMDPANQPDHALAMDQWWRIKETIERLGGTVDVIDQRQDSPDMVYAMNLGLVVNRSEPAATSPAPLAPPRVVLSHMRYPQRRLETGSAQRWFEARGFATTTVGRDGVGPHFEAGDAFPFGDALLVGYGPRSDELVVKHLATELGVRVRGFRIIHPGLYHFDVIFCPLDERRAIVCPDGLDAASARELMSLVPEPLVLTQDEAIATFAANSIVVPSATGGPATVLMPDAPARVRRQLEAWGFATELLDTSEFLKGGGSIRCMTNPLDIVIGRDLPSVPGGAVVLPPV